MVSKPKDKPKIKPKVKVEYKLRPESKEHVTRSQDEARKVKEAADKAYAAAHANGNGSDEDKDGEGKDDEGGGRKEYKPDKADADDAAKVAELDLNTVEGSNPEAVQLVREWILRNRKGVGYKRLAKILAGAAQFADHI